jgi:thioredoxin 1
MENSVLLKFEAAWCQPCKHMTVVMNDNTPSDLAVQIIDIDENIEVAKEYGVRGVPTLILMREGKEVARQVGLLSANEYRKFISQ